MRNVRDYRDSRDRARRGGSLLGFLTGGEQKLSGAATGTQGEALTFTRASVKNGIDANGALVQVGSGKPCIESQGLSVEPAHTNQTENSEDLTLWNIRGTCTVTPGQIAPNGLATACRVAGVIGAASGDLYCNAGVIANAHVAISFWLRRVSTSGVLDITSAAFPEGHWTIDLATLPDGYVRVDANSPYVTVLDPFVNDTAGIQIHRASGATPLSFDLWGVQIETGAITHSYIGTAGTGVTATVNVDVASFDGSKLSFAMGRVTFDFTPRWSTPAGTLWLMTTRNAATGHNGFQIYVDTSRQVHCETLNNAGSASGIITSPLTWNPGQAYRLSFAWGSGNLALYRDGVLVASDTSGTAVMPEASNPLFVGVYSDGTTGPSDGWVANLHVEGSP